MNVNTTISQSHLIITNIIKKMEESLVGTKSCITNSIYYPMQYVHFSCTICQKHYSFVHFIKLTFGKSILWIQFLIINLCIVVLFCWRVRELLFFSLTDSIKTWSAHSILTERSLQNSKILRRLSKQTATCLFFSLKCQKREKVFKTSAYMHLLQLTRMLRTNLTLIPQFCLTDFSLMRI